MMLDQNEEMSKKHKTKGLAMTDKEELEKKRRDLRFEKLKEEFREEKNEDQREELRQITLREIRMKNEEELYTENSLEERLRNLAPKQTESPEATNILKQALEKTIAEGKKPNLDGQSPITVGRVGIAHH